MISTSSWRPRKRAAWWVPKSELGGWKQGIQIDYMMTISISFIEFHLTSKPLGIIQLRDSLVSVSFNGAIAQIQTIFNPRNPQFQISETEPVPILRCVFCRSSKGPKPQSPAKQLRNLALSRELKNLPRNDRYNPREPTFGTCRWWRRRWHGSC